MTAKTRVTAKIEKWLRFYANFWLRLWCHAKFQTSHLVHIHRVIFYIL